MKDQHVHGQTRLTVRRPWGFFDKRGTRLLCSDGVVRSVAYLAETPDTFFSTPAAVRVTRDGKRHYVTGYMSVEESCLAPTYKPERRAYVFRHHDGNEHLLPAWPTDKFSPEFFALLASGEETPDPK